MLGAPAQLAAVRWPITQGFAPAAQVQVEMAEARPEGLCSAELLSAMRRRNWRELAGDALLNSDSSAVYRRLAAGSQAQSVSP